MSISKPNSIENFSDNVKKPKRYFIVKNIGYSLIIIMNSIACVNNTGLKKNIIGIESKSNAITRIEIPSKLIATRSDYQTKPVPPNSVIMGYLMEGQMPTDSQFKNMTHVGISFLQATNNRGEVSMTTGWENLNEIIASAHANDVKALISFGGGGFKVTSELMGVKDNRHNLISNIIKFIRDNDLDGFDCDWEPSWINNKSKMEKINNAITNYYITFIKEFREALDKEFGKGNKIFTAAILNANSIWYSNKKQIAHFPQNGWWHYLDWVSLMNYDNDLGSKHATFESVFGPEGSVSYWTSFGIPQSKIVIGIPFYARAGWGEEFLTYKDIIRINPNIPDTLDFVLHSKSILGIKKEYGFNGVSTLVRKVKEGKKLSLTGIMFWRLAGDVPVDHEKSLLAAMSEELKR
tara:strand:+ start:1140 stop:2360 length:1221 start_codon:yes stop_codon:yes gene_type:complete